MVNIHRVSATFPVCFADEREDILRLRMIELNGEEEKNLARWVVYTRSIQHNKTIERKKSRGKKNNHNNKV